MMIDVDELTGLARPKGMPFRIGKLGHVVINVRDIARSVHFYTEVLGFEVSDITRGRGRSMVCTFFTVAGLAVSTTT